MKLLWPLEKDFPKLWYKFWQVIYILWYWHVSSQLIISRFASLFFESIEWCPANINFCKKKERYVWSKTSTSTLSMDMKRQIIKVIPPPPPTPPAFFFFIWALRDQVQCKQSNITKPKQLKEQEKIITQIERTTELMWRGGGLFLIIYLFLIPNITEWFKPKRVIIWCQSCLSEFLEGFLRFSSNFLLVFCMNWSL